MTKTTFCIVMVFLLTISVACLSIALLFVTLRD